MRCLVLALALGVGVAACDRTDAARAPAPGSGSGPSQARAEQERFDRERRPDLIVAALGIGPGARVADVGAGSGLLTVHLARAVRPNGKVVATDIDPAVLDLLAARIHDAGLDAVVERRLVKADAPGLEPGAYDAILLSEVDHYFDDPVAWLKAAAPALKSGGRILITNRIHRRARSVAAAAKAGLEKVSETSPMPSHFIAIYKRP